jgi:hypothetical protein
MMSWPIDIMVPIAGITQKNYINLNQEGRGVHAVAQLVEALRYKPEDRWFDSRRSYWSFLLPSSFRPHYGPGVDSASNRSEYEGYLVGVKDNLTTFTRRLSGNLGNSASWNPRGLASL